MNLLQRAVKVSPKVLQAVAAVALLAPMTGCFENDRPRQRERVVVEERTVRPPPDRVIVERSTWYDDPRYSGGRYDLDKTDRHTRDDTDLPGRFAHEEAAAKGTVRWTPMRPVFVWVTTGERNRVLWSGRLFPSEELEVVPHRDRIFINHHQVKLIPKMEDDAHYRIYSDRGASRF